MVKTMVVYTLARCPECRTRYALMPDPGFNGQWLFFDRDRGLEQPTHIAVGGLLCLHGHSLEVQSEEAAQIEDGRWLNLGVPRSEHILN
jgi:hypothetical protein